MITGLTILAVAGGGALGSVARYIVTVMMNRLLPTWPAGTMVVNIIGSLAIGYLATLGIYGNRFSLEMKLLLITGFLGGFTTFSTYMFETVTALLDHRYQVAIMSFAGQLLLGSLGCLGGIMVAYALMKV